MGKNGTWNIFAQENRGILFDIFIFVLNLTLMPFLAKAFVDTGAAAAAGQRPMQSLLFLFFAAMFIFQPLGATFKRWSFHQRRRGGRRKKKNADGFIFSFADDGIWSFLFNPIVYFLALLFISSIIITYLNQLITHKFFSDDDPYFIVFILLGFLASVVHSAAAFKYFISPTKEPNKKIFAKPSSELIGDIFLFLNMFMFQLLWNVVGQIRIEKTGDPGGFALRIFFMLCIGLLIYYPARIFYAAEDLKKPLAWFTIALAQLPLIIRIFLM
jgi:hypothetical protein